MNIKNLLTSLKRGLFQKKNNHPDDNEIKKTKETVNLLNK